MNKKSQIFEGLFVLEMANNHWGSVDRGLKIITDYSRIVRFNNVRAAIKLQFRDVDAFIHKDFRQCSDIRYIKKNLDTQLSKEEYGKLVDAVRKSGCIPMATPFDEVSVETCVQLNVDIIKIASSDINDWVLIDRIAATKKPVIISTGGSSLKDIDDVVSFFSKRNVPLAINHCVSVYPSEDRELEINQVKFLKDRYPNNVIGLSTHEYTDWKTSITLACAMGAQTFERHVDIEGDEYEVSPYCSLPHQIDQWFKAYKKAAEMCGAGSMKKRMPLQKEVQYLDKLVRGVYSRHDLKKGDKLGGAEVYLAIPLQKGQISCREWMNGEVVQCDVPANQPIMIEMIDSPYANDEQLKALIYSRGL